MPSTNVETRKEKDEPLLLVDEDVCESAMQTTGLFRFQKIMKTDNNIELFVFRVIMIDTHWGVVFLHRCNSTYPQDLDISHCESFGPNLHGNIRERHVKGPDLIFTIW